MDVLDSLGFYPSSYSTAIGLFTRLLGVIYVFVYFPFLFQIKGLLGKDGIRPVSHFVKFVKKRLGKSCYYRLPSLFWINSSDMAQLLLIWSGIFLGFMLIFSPYQALVLFLLYLIHLSLTSVGQDFLSFGWETFLMEITVATFLTVATVPYSIFGWIALNFLLLRFHVQAGVSKIFSHDPNWRNLTAISYHYLTQPLPNTIAWYFHKFPMWFHKASTALMFFIEIVAPMAIFALPEIRLAVFLLLAGLQAFIWLTGNLSYLNHLTAILCLILINNKFFDPFFSYSIEGFPPSSTLWQIVIETLGFAYLVLQMINLWQTFFPNYLLNRILAAVQPFHISYPHGLFAVMTTKRYEIIIEGSNDAETWHEYEFFYKPGDLSWRPRRISPYQPRLDWQAWFLPFAHFQHQIWFQIFLTRLLQGTPQVVKLLKHNPFRHAPPKYIRVLMYDYVFTTVQEKAATGNWWKRELVGPYTSILQLQASKETSD